jgi:hypothetical protein
MNQNTEPIPTGQRPDVAQELEEKLGFSKEAAAKFAVQLEEGEEFFTAAPLTTSGMDAESLDQSTDGLQTMFGSEKDESGQKRFLSIRVVKMYQPDGTESPIDGALVVKKNPQFKGP